MRARHLTIVLIFLLGVLPCAAQVPEPEPWQWRFITGGETVGWPVLDSDGTAYFTTADRYLYSVDTAGALNWRTDLGRRPAGLLAVGPDGSLYCGLEDGRFLALNKDGRLLWEVDLARGELLPPLVTDAGMVILADRTGRLSAYTHRGQRIWSVDLDENLTAGPVFDYDSFIVAGSDQGNVFRVSIPGELRGRRFVGSVPVSLVPVRDALLIGSNLGFVIKLLEDGEPAWRVDLGSAIAELVAAPAGSAYARLDDGTLAHVSDEGTASWRVAPLPSVVRSPIAARGVLLLTSGGSLAHVGPDGLLSWQRAIVGDPLVAAATSSRVLVSTANWVTYSFEVSLGRLEGWFTARGSSQGRGAPAGVTIGRHSESVDKESTDYVYLSRFLRSPFAENQLMALEEIEKRLDPDDEIGLAGSYGYILDLCEEVAGAPYYGQVGYAGRNLTTTEARRRALSILARIGDVGTSRFLIRLLQAEESETIQAEILRTLGALGTGLRGDVIRTVARVVSSSVARRPSDQLAIAAADCIGEVYRYEGGFVSPAGVELLTSFVVGAYSRATRDAAREALAELSRGL